MSKKEEIIDIKTEYIKLDQFLKWTAIAESGSMAKDMILDGKIKVNDEIETKRGRKLYPDYKIEVFDKIYIVRKR